ncbi:uncharacterized protein METZ01_LOCUS210800, partial [marine metagenome]
HISYGALHDVPAPRCGTVRCNWLICGNQLWSRIKWRGWEVVKQATSLAA